MVLIYNSELDVIICSEIFCTKKLRRSIMYSLVSLVNFLVRCGGRSPHEVLRQSFIFIYRLRLRNHQPNSCTKSAYSTWIALKKPPVTEKSVASFMDQREYNNSSCVLSVPPSSLLVCPTIAFKVWYDLDSFCYISVSCNSV